MKYILTEDQYNRLKQELNPIIEIPSLSLFNNDWESLQKYLNKKGNPKYSIVGDLNLRNSQIESLGNLTSVGGDLELDNTPIESLGSLTSVGGNLYLYNTPIESLGNLTSVGGNLYLENTPLLKKYSRKKIKDMIEVKGHIFI
jgi:hypothetical protein